MTLKEIILVGEPKHRDQEGNEKPTKYRQLPKIVKLARK